MSSPCSSSPTALINLDYAASTPLRPEAREAERAFDESELAGANPNSLHTLGRRAHARLETARRYIAQSLSPALRPSELIFTGGGSEANALALFGLAEACRARAPRKRRVIVSAIEHDSILDNLGQLRARGFETSIVSPCRAGFVEPNALKDLMDDDVALVSIMLANNETGVIQPISELTDIAHSQGALFHTDAIQGWLHTPFDVRTLGVDALSFAGHKVGAPVSIGGLYLSHACSLVPLARGGGQERGFRAGTQDVRAILALEAVVRALAPRLEDTSQQVKALADRLYAKLSDIPGVVPSIGNPAAVPRLPGIVSILVSGFESEDLILRLDAAGFEVSAASACSSADLEPSHVLRAMGIPRELALGALRISFDERVCATALDSFVIALKKIVLP